MKKILILFLWIPVFSWAQLVPGLQTYKVGNRYYDVRTPENYNPYKEYPIVFELHPFGGNRKYMDRDFDQYTQNILKGTVDEQQFISVRPEGNYVEYRWPKKFKGNVWNVWGSFIIKHLIGNLDDVKYITDVYNDLQSRMGYIFNSNKVYIFGFSNGGAMAMKMIEETNLFRAGVIRSMSFEQGHTIPSGASKIPMMFIHGTSDTFVPYNGGKAKGFELGSPTFESVKTTVDKWVQHNDLKLSMETEFLKKFEGGNAQRTIYYREYHNQQTLLPLYFFVIQDSPHETDKDFELYIVKRAMMRFFRDPIHYGIFRNN